MGKYKKLQDLADNSLAEYHSDEVEKELKAVIKNNQQKKANSNKRIGIFWSSVATAIVAVVAIAVTVFSPMFKQSNEDKNYNIGNQVMLDSDLASLNADLLHFKLTVDSEAFIVKIIDTYYDETLYYNINISNDSGEALEIFIVTNKDYKFSFDHKLDNRYNIENYVLSYTENFDELDVDLYYEETFGVLLSNDEKLYFSYNNIVFKEESSFVEIIKQIIEIK